MPDLWLYWVAAAFLFGMAFRTVIATIVHLIRAPVVRDAEVKQWADTQRFVALGDRVVVLAQAIEKIQNYVDDHVHTFDYAPIEHDHVHEHPHQHEHQQHVHTLVPLSKHETNGHTVIVKRCEACSTIFRDQAEPVHG